MITFQPISTKDAQHYQFMEKLLRTAFPPEEYRDLNELREYTDYTNNFYNNLLWEEEKPIGFITYWDFEEFYYVEHFAIDPSLRNGGYGQKVLNALREKINLPIVLEVEMPLEEMSQRRINFYKRQGYILWDNEYRQPPYKPGDSFLPMHLMVNGNLNSENDFEKVKSRIYKEVYNVRK